MPDDTANTQHDAAEIPAMCVHADGTEHPAPSELVWDEVQERWVRMYSNCTAVQGGDG